VLEPPTDPTPTGAFLNRQALWQAS
jgi:hypothetical protein